MSRGTRRVSYLTLKDNISSLERAKRGERLGGSDALRASFCVKMHVGRGRGCDFPRESGISSASIPSKAPIIASW